MPLLSTLDKLLTRGYLDELLVMESGQFVDGLLTNMFDEVRGCTDVKRLLAIAGVTLNLLQPDLQTIDLVRKNLTVRVTFTLRLIDSMTLSLYHQSYKKNHFH